MHLSILQLNDALKFGIAGAIGGLCKEIIDDGAIQLPKIADGKLFLGGLTTILLGGIVGYIIDHSIISAFSAGYVGWSILDGIMQKTQLTISKIVPDKKQSDESTPTV